MQALEVHDDGMTLACFEVDGLTYALDVAQLREVVRWQPVTPLPKAPALIEGVIDLRGAVIPVIDLGRALGGDRACAGSDARIAVTEVDGLVLGLAVDAAVEVQRVDVTTLEDPPGVATQAGYDATRAVVRREGQSPMMLLSLEHPLESVYRSALPGADAGGGAAS